MGWAEPDVEYQAAYRQGEWDAARGQKTVYECIGLEHFTGHRCFEAVHDVTRFD